MGKKYAKKGGYTGGKPAASMRPPASLAEWERELTDIFGMKRLRHDDLASNIEILCLSGSTMVTIDGKSYTLTSGHTLNVRSRG